jgi:hypothetical protein
MYAEGVGDSEQTRGAAPLEIPFVRLWITAVRFALQAETELRQGTQTAFAASAILADASLEASVGALRMHAPTAPRSDRPDRDWLPVALRAIAPHVGIDAGAERAMLNCHDLRTGALHRGQSVNREDAERSCHAARLALSFVATSAARSAGSTPGQGLGDVVADVVHEHPAAQALRAAQAAVVASDPRAAMLAASGALGVALASSEPKLPRDRFGSGRHWQGSRAAVGNRPLEDALQDHGDALDRLEDWIVPVALGVTPRDLTDLRHSLPPFYISGPQWRDGLDESRAPELVERVCLLVLRMWEAGLLPRPYWFQPDKPAAAAEAE